MRGTKEHHAICRKEDYSIPGFIFGGLLCELKSLSESKSGSKILPKIKYSHLLPQVPRDYGR